MRKTFFLAFYFCFTWLFTANGQLAPIALPKISPVDPTVAAFARYGDIPVDYSTGVPNISIPLFDIKSREFDIPVNVSYHAAGIKVQDIATPVGLGWNLNVGAFVSCSYTHRDGWPTTPKPPFKTKADLQYYIDTSSGLNQAFNMEQYKGDYYDLESDRYYFNLGNGKNGAFFYDYLTDTLRMAQYSPVKIERMFNLDTLIGFKIKDTDGSIYLLDKYFAPNNGSFSFFVSKIISSNLTDTISFSYEVGDLSWLYPVSKVQEFGHWFRMQDPPPIECGHPEELSPNWTITSASQGQVPAFSLNIINISSTLANYIFTYSNDREDINKTRLISIEVQEKIANERKKKIVFEHSYFGTSAEQNQRLRLDKIKFFGSYDTDGSQEYSFKYNSRDLPRYHTLTYQHYSEDYWGYYNGNTGDGLIPSAILPSDKRNDGYSLFREPTHEMASACMLEEIHYPTGGKTEFIFEPNEATENIYEYENDMASYSSKKVGGFRIKQIINYSDSNTISSKKTYDYNGGGFARHITKEMFWHPQRYFFYLYTDDGCYAWWSYERYRDQYFGIPLSPLTIGSSLPVVYLQVTEYNGDSVNNTGKTVYSYDLPKSFYDAPVILPRPLSSQEYNFIDRGVEAPPLVNKQIFKKADTGYQKVYSLFNAYTTYKAALFHTGVVVEFPSTYVPTNTSYIDLIASDDGGSDGKYWVEDRQAAQDVDLLTQTTENIDGISKTTTFSYDPNTLQPIEKWSLDSKGDTLKLKFKYASDFAGTAVYDTMVARNMISPPIETLSYKNGNFLQAEKTNYNFRDGSDWSMVPANQILKQTVATKNLYQPEYQTRINFNRYDALDNVLEQQKANDLKNSYIWGYNGNYPIAEVTNAASNEIFFEGFEESNTWYYITALDNLKPHTGKYSARIDNPGPGEYFCHSMKSLNISLTAPTKFKYSGWIYSNGPSVELLFFMKRNGETGYYSYIDGISTTVTGKWVYLEKEFTVPADVTQLNMRIDNNSPGTVWYDDIRLHPGSAMMTTYTYSPLIGITSKSDVNSKPVYYEYDEQGRLTLIRDQDRNIIKKICYNYAGQTEACSFNITADWQNTLTAIRCKTLSGSNTGEREQEQKDMNSHSPTYNQLRWVVVDQNCTVCPKPASWQVTGNYRCAKDGNNENTGVQEKEEMDMESCSPTYNQTRWVYYTTNLTACPLPCNTSNCSGADKKCVNGICETGVRHNKSSVKVKIDGVFYWRCTYYYCFSDYTATADFVEDSFGSCSVGSQCLLD